MIGGHGFIGLHLTTELKSQNHYVVVVDALDPQVHGEFPENNSTEADEFYRRDVRQEGWWDSIQNPGEKFDAVYFLASDTGTAQSMWDSSRYVSNNLLALTNLHDLYMRRISGRENGSSLPNFDRLILTSSRAVYKSCPSDADGNPIASSESERLEPISIYGATKSAQEDILMAGFPGCSKAIIRLQNVYGPGQSSLNPYTGVVSTFVQRAVRGEELTLFSRSSVVRDFVFVVDVAKVLAQLAQYRPEDPVILNAGTGVATSIEDLAREIVEISGMNSAIKFLDSEVSKVGEVKVGLADITLASNHGYFFPTTLHDGLKKTLESASRNSVRRSPLPDIGKYVREIREKLPQI